MSDMRILRKVLHHLVFASTSDRSYLNFNNYSRLSLQILFKKKLRNNKNLNIPSSSAPKKKTKSKMKAVLLALMALAAASVVVCQAMSMVGGDYFNSLPGQFGTVNEAGRGRALLNKMVDMVYELPCAGLPRANTSNSFVANIMLARSPMAGVSAPQTIPANVTAQENTLIRAVFAAARGAWIGTGAGADDVARCAALTDANQKLTDFRKKNNLDGQPESSPHGANGQASGNGGVGIGVAGSSWSGSFPTSHWNTNTQWSNNGNAGAFAGASGSGGLSGVGTQTSFQSPNGQMGINHQQAPFNQGGQSFSNNGWNSNAGGNNGGAFASGMVALVGNGSNLATVN